MVLGLSFRSLCIKSIRLCRLLILDHAFAAKGQLVGAWGDVRDGKVLVAARVSVMSGLSVRCLDRIV